MRGRCASRTGAFAIAKLVSLSVALMAGDRALIAVTPQIEVPQAMRVLILCGSPSLFPSQGTKMRPEAMLVATAGNPMTPVDTKSAALSLAPTHTMPN